MVWMVVVANDREGKGKVSREVGGKIGKLSKI